MTKAKWTVGLDRFRILFMKDFLKECPGWMQTLTHKMMGNGWRYLNSFVDPNTQRRVLDLTLSSDQSYQFDSCDLILTIDSTSYQQEVHFRLKSASDIHVKRVLRLRQKSDERRLIEFISIQRKYGNLSSIHGPFDVWKPL
jgi:hypothetical protein